MMINVAIDGPAGAGKSTIAKAAAKALGYIYVDTGALYRTVALGAVRAGVLESDDGIAALLPNLQVELKFVDGSQHVYLNGEDVSDLIRTPEISMGASKVSAVPAVRAFLLDLQRDLAKKNNGWSGYCHCGVAQCPGEDLFVRYAGVSRASPV